MRKHITRPYGDFNKHVERPVDEYVKFEVFSFDPDFTQIYSVKEANMGTKNVTIGHWRSITGYCSSNMNDQMTFTIPYNVNESGEYRIDLLYEQSSHLWGSQNSKYSKYDTGENLVASMTLLRDGVEYKSSNLRWEGEDNCSKRIPLFYDLTDGEYEFIVNVPHNCIFIGAVIRKIKYFQGTNQYGDDFGKDQGNLKITACTTSFPEQIKMSELEVEALYDSSFERRDTPSGVYFNYADECNYYVKDTDDEIQRVFGGYISSAQVDDNLTTITIHCADRLIDLQTRYLLDLLTIEGGDGTDEGYSTIDFVGYPQVLRYLCNYNEVSLKNNIQDNYTVEGEKFSDGHIITFGKGKLVNKISTKNAEATPSKNYIMLRNYSEATVKQTWKLYDASKVAQKPPQIYGVKNNRKIDFGNIHITYGLGDPLTPLEKKITEKVDTAETTAGAQKWSKCGVSQDGKYLMAIGLPSAAGEVGKYGYKYYKRVFERKCPNCGSTNLIWDWHWAGGHADKGYSACRGNNEGGSYEGHVFCKGCDADWSIFGKGHPGPTGLKAVSSPVRSSAKEAQKLKNGEMVAVPDGGAALDPDDIFKAITKEAFKYKYRLRGNTASSYNTMKAVGAGDCWAFSDLIYTKLKELGVKCMIKQYATSAAPNGTHRSVLYKNDKKQWVDFPYREYGWNTKYNNMLNNTSASKSGKTVAINKNGTTIGRVSVKSAKTTKTQTTKVTITKGYDKDKPIQAFLEIIYSTEPSFTAKKYKLALKFTLNAPSGMPSINSHEFPLYWINNTIKKSRFTQSITEFIHNVQGYECDIYLQKIYFVAPAKKVTDDTENKDVTYFKSDNSTLDNSSCKMRLYQIVFNDNRYNHGTKLSSCGKTILDQMTEIVNETGYYVNMDYGYHRKDDVIHFTVSSQTEPVLTATDGNWTTENGEINILDWQSITFNPVSTLHNMSQQVYKADDGKYHYVDSRDQNSIFLYGEKCILETSNVEGMSAEEAYFNAVHNANYNPEQRYTYTITVPGYPDVKLGDLIKIRATAKQLSDLKEIKSIKVIFDKDNMPRLKTEIGLDELAPDFQLQKMLVGMRDSARKDTTSFSDSASPTNRRDIYEWDG